MTAYWNTFEVTYRNLGAPLKPCLEDVRVIEVGLTQWCGEHVRPRYSALLCGVTPALAELRLPPGAHLLAVEQSQSMIEAIWPGDTPARTVMRGNWFELPIAPRSCDIVLGDGCFNCVDYPDGYRGLFDSLCRVLARDGIVFMRFFMRPDEREDCDTVFDDLLAGRIPNFHIFKWRLAMALQASTEEGIAVGAVYAAWAARGIDTGGLAAELNWPQAAIATICNYRDKDTRLSFPTRQEIRDAMPRGLREVLYREPGYPLGERCPMFAYTPC